MSQSASLANRLLGYPPDSRLLILNADDFGMCHAINQAITGVLAAGTVRSTTLMVPCPWAAEAMQYLAEHREQPFGIHLTVISDHRVYRWGPVMGRDRVPSLVDDKGHFHGFDAFHANLPKAALRELELEFRAQIEQVLAAGLKPTHLDWHAIRFGSRVDIFDLMIGLAKEYRLALRVIGRSWIEKLQGEGLPVIDYDFYDGSATDPRERAGRYMQMLRELPAGLSEWAVHPGLNDAELRAMEGVGSAYRQADFDFWTSPDVPRVIQEEGIILLDYRALQPFWAAR